MKKNENHRSSNHGIELFVSRQQKVLQWRLHQRKDRCRAAAGCRRGGGRPSHCVEKRAAGLLCVTVAFRVYSTEEGSQSKRQETRRPLVRQQSLYTAFTVCVIVLEKLFFFIYFHFSPFWLFPSTFCSMKHDERYYCHANFRHRRSPSFPLRFEIASAFQPTFVISDSDQPLRRQNLCHQLIVLTFLATFTSR